MSFSVLGWIEFRDRFPVDDDEEAWHAVVDAMWLLPQNHSTSCGCLFGIRNYSEWQPAVPARGLPDDVSKRVLSEATAEGYFYYSATWLTWREVQEVNWDESVVDAFVHQYRLANSGDYVRAGGYKPEPWCRHPNAPHDIAENDTWTEGDLVCRVERITRREAAWSAFSGVFELMAFFSRRYGDDNVRLVVWFGE